jgi:aminoglycoside phosphotransferase (APT) family kinase protein
MTESTPESTRMERARVGEDFPSRKNRVFRVKVDGVIRVAKIFPQEAADRAEKEYEMLGRCRRLGVPVPAPILLRENVIMMEYVDGSSLAELFDSLYAREEEIEGFLGGSQRSILDGLASWLARFHSSLEFKMYRGDSILKNFILSGDQVYGVDFEEAGEGDPFTDIGQVCSYALSTAPMFTKDKFQFVQDLAARYYHITKNDRSCDLAEAVAQGLEHYAPFRADKELMIAWARRLRANGMPSH